jgi:hypothetical protein
LGIAGGVVAMQESMMKEMAKYGLDYTHFPLYFCGDNLYPTIREVPPARGEEPMRPNGKRTTPPPAPQAILQPDPNDPHDAACDGSAVG